MTRSSLVRCSLRQAVKLTSTMCPLLLVLMMIMVLLLPEFGQCQKSPSSDDSQLVLVRSNVTNSTQAPSNIQLTFSLITEKVSLFLVLNENIPSNATITTCQNGVLSKYVSASPQSYAYYIDVLRDASILVEMETGIDGTVSYKYTGIFQVKGETYTISPERISRDNRRRRRSRRGLRRTLGRREADSSAIHKIQKENTTIGQTGSTLRLPNGMKPPPLFERIDSTPDDGDNTLTDRPPKTMYVVQLLPVIDYRLYQQMYNLSTKSTDEARRVDTINRITQLFGHVVNGVDMLYRSINTSDTAINVHYAGCIIAQDPESSPFVENNRVTIGSSTYIPAVRALSDFAIWIAERQENLPPHNQASLYALDPLNGITGDRITGLAYYKSMCTDWSALICRHSSLYSLSEVTAHELGHNFGAVHDGIDNECSAALQNIMAASSAPLTDATYKNAYRFSSCSVAEITGYLKALPRDNCLTRQSNSTNSSLSSDVMTPLGTVYSPDEQCAVIYGFGSFYCSGLNEDKQICRTMQCFHPVWQYCTATYEQRAFSGTQCGNKTWCYMGDCVYDEMAPALAPGASADCLYGDSKAPVPEVFTCSNVSSKPWNCYRQNVANACCRSCRAAKIYPIPGCEYGNRIVGCAEISMPDCQNLAFRNSCCKFCADLDSTPAPTSSSTTTKTTTLTTTTTPTTTTTTTKPSTSTPTTTATTASTKLTTRPSGLQCINVYGSWCLSPTNFPTPYCYTPNQYYCCALCASIRDDSRPGCEYGDRYSWCDLSRCATPSDRQSCCDTCSSVLSSTSTTTTSTSTTTTTSRTTTPTTTTTPSTTSTLTTTKTSTTTPSTTTTSTTMTSTSTTRTTTTTTSTTTAPTTTVLTGRLTKTAAPASDCVDNSTICASINQQSCYSIPKRNMCCITCRKFATGPPGCEYGDLYPVICDSIGQSKMNCPSYKVECCRTCGGPTSEVTMKSVL